MATDQPPHADPGQTVQVFAAEDVFVCHGVNQGDAMGPPDAVVLEDLYQLDPGALPRALILRALAGRARHVAPQSPIGRPGADVALLARHTLMARDGERVEVLLLDLGDGHAVLPLSPMAPGEPYALVAIDADPGDLRLADLLSLSFARGTLITRGDGTQAAIETLKPGDAILTRDHGRQPLRWIGQTRMRAAGAFAPVVITAGRLGNTGDLILGRHHRVFLYPGRLGPDAADLLVQAHHLIDDETVYVREGGAVDWFSLVFDAHEIVYAEGIPSESLLVTDAVLDRLPPEVAAEVARRFPGLSQTQHFATRARPRR